MLFPFSRKNLAIGLYAAMIFSAATHLLTNFFGAIMTNNPDLINMFNVLGISLIFPALGHGNLNCLLGIIMVILLGVAIYVLHQFQDIKQGRRKK